MSSPRYRPNVAAIIKRPDGKILIGERSDVSGAWQFPQGGVKGRETALEALSRELQEETSLEPEHYRVIESNGPYRYLFLPGRTKESFDGQEQTFFLVELMASDSSIKQGPEKPEFSHFRWIEPGEFQIGWVPDFKKDVYRQVFADFFEIHF
jgi:putative (di)nucleoside polyphosphate hydrolase